MPGKQYQTITFTSFEPREILEQKLRDCGASWWLYGVEKTADGRTHLQGMAYAKKKCSWLTKMKPNHIEPCRSPLDSIAYCKKGEQSHEEWDKEGTKGPNYGKNAEVYTEGDQPTFNIAGEKEKLTNRQMLDGKLETLVEEESLSLYNYEKVKRAKTLFLLHTAMKTIPTQKALWIWGEPRSGKTTAVLNHYGVDKVFLKPQNKWWDGYDGEKIILLDDFDKGGTCLGHYLKIWADTVMPIKGEIKGTTSPLPYDRFIVTSNYSIEELFAGDEMLIQALRGRFHVQRKDTKLHTVDF